MSCMSSQKYIVFLENITNVKKQDLLYIHEDVMDAVSNGKKLIKTCSFISLDFELVTKYGYTIIIDFNISDKEKNSLYDYEKIGIMSAVKFEIGSEYPEGKFDGSENLQELYKSGKLKKYVNQYKFQNYSYTKLLNINYNNLPDFIETSPTYTFRRSEFFSSEALTYQMKNEYIEISKKPSNKSIGGFIPHLLKWYRESSLENHKELIEYVNDYYGCIPHFLKDEFYLVSTTEDLRIKYFSHIYQLIYVNQIEEQDLEYRIYIENSIK